MGEPEMRAPFVAGNQRNPAYGYMRRAPKGAAFRLDGATLDGESFDRPLDLSYT